MRESAVFQAGHENNREFQTFGSVNRHESGFPFGFAPLGKPIRIRDERNLIEPLPQPGIRILGGELYRHRV